MEQTIWQILVTSPNPDRMAIGKDGGGEPVYTGAPTVQVPWDGNTYVGDAVYTAVSALRTANPGKDFAVRAIGTQKDAP